jgi:leucyl aminopeptidase
MNRKKMKITTNKIDEKDVTADILVLPLFEEQPTDIYSDIDSLTGNVISGLVNTGDFSGKHGQTLLVPVKGMNTARILLAGLGKRNEITQERVRRAGAKAFQAITNYGLVAVSISVRIFKESGLSDPVFCFLEGGLLSLYRYDKYKTESEKEKPDKEIDSVSVLCEADAVDIKWLQAVVSAVHFAKDMISAPANDMTPSVIAKIATDISHDKLKITVLDRTDIEKEKMGAYLSVTKGSDEPPKFIVVEYSNGEGNPIVIIGKTITFDSGGLDVKPGDGMEKMKYDMSGGAVALAVIKTVAELGLPLNLIAILAAAENLLGGSASRPGDVVSTITGKTVEIISTDAEGRLTLADAIGYAVKYKAPSAIIDIATLTGACNVAFGNEAIAMMGNDARLMDKLRSASEEVYERVWPMPLFEEYGDYLKSDIADIKNVGGRKAALCSSAYFLKDFAGAVPWAHLDIAGAAWNETDRPYSPKGASAIGVRLLLNFLRRR